MASTSLYGYRPSLALSFSLVAVYSVLVAACASFVVTILARRRHRHRPSQRVRARAAAAWMPFTLCLAMACLLELAGYIYRVDGWERPAQSEGFKAQLVLLVIAPIFLTAALSLSLEQLTVLLADEQPSPGTDGEKVDSKKYSRVLLPLCAVTLVVQAIGAALSGQAQSDYVLQQQQNASSNSSASSISAGDMVVIIGFVLQLNALCIAGYRFLVVVWQQSTFRPGAAMRDGLVELENASSGWRRRLLQSQRGGDGSGSGGRSQRDGDDTSRGGMPGMPAPVTVAATTTAPPAAAASQYTQVPYAIAEEDEHQQRHLHGHHSQPPAAQPSPRSRSRRRFGRGFFYAALIIATILILARTAFRVVEFSQPSWRRSTATTSTIGNPNDSSSGGAGAGTVEILLALFDGSFVALAAALLLAAHPLLTLVSDPSLVLAAQTREERAHAWYYGPGAGGAERHRRVQDWVETITLGGGGSTTTGAGGGGARSMSRRFSWVSSSRWTGRSGGGEQQQQQEVGANGVVEPERAVIPMYR